MLREALAGFDYRETKYWASFRTNSSGRAVAQLNPSKNRIRLFLGLNQDTANDLIRTPSSASWGSRFPSVFEIKRDDDIPRATELIVLSAAQIGPRSLRRTKLRPETAASEELPADTDYFEGAAKVVAVNAYERSKRARAKSIQHYGAVCVVCGFDFLERYGDTAAGYIHIHHVVPLSSIRASYRLDPIVDLRPVCPNCHAVIHRREPPYSIEEVQEMIRNPKR